MIISINFTIFTNIKVIGGIDMFEIPKTPQVQAMLQRAFHNAQQNNNPTIELAHIMTALLDDKDGLTQKLFSFLEISTDDLKEFIRLESMKLPKKNNVNAKNSPMINDILVSAEDIARHSDSYFITKEHILIAICQTQKEPWKSEFHSLNFTKDHIDEVLKSFNNTPDNSPSYVENSVEDFLKKYTKNITDLAIKGDLPPIIKRDAEIEKIIQILLYSTKNPLLLGDAGIGKTAIITGIAQAILQDNIPESLKNYTIISLNLRALIAGATNRNQIEEILQSIIATLEQKINPTILFISEIHLIIGIDVDEENRHLLKSILEHDKIKVVGATNLEEYCKYIEQDTDLKKIFKTIVIEEPSKQDTIAILKDLKKSYESYRSVRITDSALVSAVIMSIRYFPNLKLPNKAIDIIDEAVAKTCAELESEPKIIEKLRHTIAKLEIKKTALKNILSKELNPTSQKNLQKLEKRIVKKQLDLYNLQVTWDIEKEQVNTIKDLKKEIKDLENQEEKFEREKEFEKAAKIHYDLLPKKEAELSLKEKKLNRYFSQEKTLIKEKISTRDIAQIVSSRIGIPVSRIIKSEKERVIHLEEYLESRVIGQQEAIQDIANTIKRSQAGLTSKDKALGSFLFLGPAGVGKTELSKALAEFLFDDDKHLIKISMSEYMDKLAVPRLIGEHQGHSGRLTEAIKDMPYSIVLLNEIEKAHPSVFDILIQILESGSIIDGQGQKILFNQCVFIMTSNLGSHTINNWEENEKNLQNVLQDELKMVFKSEFLNNIDNMIVFHKLKQKDMGAIADLQLELLKKTLIEKYILLQVSESAKELITQEGFNPEFGAKPLKKVLNDLVLNPLANKIIEGSTDNYVLITRENDELVFLTIDSTLKTSL